MARTAGDGVQLVRSTAGIVFENVDSSTNERGGLLVDVGQMSVADTQFSWTKVTVEPNKVFGAMCQSVVGDEATMYGPGASDGTVVWDVGIERGAQAEADAVLATTTTTALDIFAAVGPCNMPAPLLVLQLGLNALITRQQ
jgi:hypothetical protein